MKPGQKYEFIPAGSSAEHAIQIVAQAVSITGPMLAERLGLSTSDISTRLIRAIELGYLTKRWTEGGRKTTVTYRLGPLALGMRHVLPAPAPERLAVVQVATEEIVKDVQLPELVPSREPAPWRALDTAILGRPPQRAGMWDFKDIPSHFAALRGGL